MAEKKKKKSTKKKGSIPTNKALYARVKAEAKRKLFVWLVQQLKKENQ